MPWKSIKREDTGGLESVFSLKLRISPINPRHFSITERSILITMSAVKVLVTGVTGYMGGSILSQLVSSRYADVQNLDISVLTRDDDRAKYFASINLKVYTIKSLDDSAAITAASSENDIVIHAANGFHAGSAQALIEGLGLRKRQMPDADVYYIHTSGTSNLADHPITKTFIENRVFSDKDQDIYNYLKERQAIEQYPQRATDIIVVETGKRENVPTTIIMSPTVYGLGSGQFNRLTIQYPPQVRGALKSGIAEYVGDGKGAWDMVHISDLASLYEVILRDRLQGAKKAPVGEKGIIFSGTGFFTWKAVAEGIAQAGFELGKLKNSNTKSVSLSEAAKSWIEEDERLGPIAVAMGVSELMCELGSASNARTKAEIGLELGWKPVKTEQDWQKAFREEFEEVLRKQGSL